MLRGWGRCSNASAVAVVDETPARLAKAVGLGLNGYRSMQQMLGDDRVQAVLIATPTAMHFEHAKIALGAMKHVMIEKPMAMNLTEAKELVAIAREKSLTLSVFQNRRWDLDYLTVQSAIASGIFGKVINIESRLGQWSSCVGPAAKEYRPGWRNEAAFGGGGLFDWGSHFVDQLWRVMLPAKAVRVFAQLRGNVWTSDCDDFARVLIDFDSGAVGMMEINTTTTMPLSRWHIDGTQGSASSPYSLEFDLKKWAELDFCGSNDGGVRRIEPARSALDDVGIWEGDCAGSDRGNDARRWTWNRC